MTKEEFFDIYYPGLKRENLSESCKMLQNALWESYDDGIIKDNHIFKTAYHICVPLYNRLKVHEDQIKNDIDELNGKHGTPAFSVETIDEISVPIQEMAFICDSYHQYFEALNDSTIDTLTKANESLKYQENVMMSVETPKIEAKSNEKEIISLKIDQEPAHKKWFVKVLNSKIPKELINKEENKESGIEQDKEPEIKTEEKKNKDQLLYVCLNCLFNELCDIGCLNSDNENIEVFIYRFSGFNGQYPPEMKLLWKGKNTFLGYITRCLISDKVNDPVGLGVIASFFQSKSGKPMNLSVQDCTFKDFDTDKNRLHPDFVKAVELLRKCGFVNVEFTSSRR